MTAGRRNGSSRRSVGGSGSSGRSGRRPGRVAGSRVTVRNSGLEVWLYDDANRQAIRAEGPTGQGYGGMPPRFEDQTRAGLVVGYSLVQDDDLDLAIHVGETMPERERSTGRWLAPQTAFLRIPSGRLCIESNDASRLGPETPTEKGAVVAVPPDDYRLTLYRIDHEALDREGLTWRGPQEIVVLTPGGTPADAVGDLLPYELHRDRTWIGQYRIEGGGAQALAWFGDSWDTFILNLDPGAATTLALVPGAYLRTEVAAAGLTLVSAFSTSWDEAKRLTPPSGEDLAEYGYAAFCPMSEWDGEVALFCRRHKTTTRVADEHQNVWLPATIVVLAPQAGPERSGRGLAPVDLAIKFQFDPGFLGVVLSDVLGTDMDDEDLELRPALVLADKKLAKLGLVPQGELAWEEATGGDRLELGCRLYAGQLDAFAAALVSDGCVELVLLTELADGTWIASGLADDLERRISTRGANGLPVPNPRVRLQSLDDALPAIHRAHASAVREAKSAAAAAPSGRAETIAAFERFLGAAFDRAGDGT